MSDRTAYAGMRDSEWEALKAIKPKVTEDEWKVLCDLIFADVIWGRSFYALPDRFKDYERLRFTWRGWARQVSDDAFRDPEDLWTQEQRERKAKVNAEKEEFSE